MYSSTQNVFLQIAKYAFSEKHLHSTPLCWNLSVEHFEAQCRPCVEPCLCAIFFCAQIVVELVQCRIWTELCRVALLSRHPAFSLHRQRWMSAFCLNRCHIDHHRDSNCKQLPSKPHFGSKRTSPLHLVAKTGKCLRKVHNMVKFAPFTTVRQRGKFVRVSYFCPILFFHWTENIFIRVFSLHPPHINIQICRQNIFPGEIS